MRRNVPIDLIAEVPGVFRCPLIVPATPWQRLRGIRRVPPSHGVLLATASVNSIGLKSSISVLALGEAGEVLATHVLVPNTTWRNGSASWILELPAEVAIPTAPSVVLLEAPKSAASRFAGTRIIT